MTIKVSMMNFVLIIIISLFFISLTIIVYRKTKKSYIKSLPRNISSYTEEIPSGPSEIRSSQSQAKQDERDDQIIQEEYTGDEIDDNKNNIDTFESIENRKHDCDIEQKIVQRPPKRGEIERHGDAEKAFRRLKPIIICYKEV